ncbi:hypothetical protein MMC21_001398 [Puttea exsequens]|nr:hypothetical protein [Puttea exsequens]
MPLALLASFFSRRPKRCWKCCKPRVLTFDEFLSIPPCTTGKHSTFDDSPLPDPPAPVNAPENVPLPLNSTSANGASNNAPAARAPQAAPQTTAPPAPPAPPESDSDDPSISVPLDVPCRRKGCNSRSTVESRGSRDTEECTYHPGGPLFHEGFKSWTCCNKSALEFDEFMNFEGCKTKKRHLFIGSKKDAEEEEKLSDVRHDFYQTPTSVIASLYIKKIDKERAKINFSSPTTIDLDLPTADNKRYRTELPLFGQIDSAQSKAKIMGTKLELTLVKKDGQSWPTLRNDEKWTGEIIQVGGARQAR